MIICQMWTKIVTGLISQKVSFDLADPICIRKPLKDFGQFLRDI